MGVLWTDNKDILVMLSDMDINAIAGTLKLYFRELPEPLLTDRLYPAFMEGIGKGSGVGKEWVPKGGSVWYCLLRDGRLLRVLPSSAHSVLAVLAGSRPARGSWCCSPGCRQSPMGQGRLLMRWLPGGIWPRWVLLLHKMSPASVLSPLPPCLQPSQILLPRRTA